MKYDLHSSDAHHYATEKGSFSDKERIADQVDSVGTFARLGQRGQSRHRQEGFNSEHEGLAGGTDQEEEGRSSGRDASLRGCTSSGGLIQSHLS